MSVPRDSAYSNLVVTNRVFAPDVTAQSVVSSTPISIETLRDTDTDVTSLVTEDFQLDVGAAISYVLTCVDEDGNAEWRPGAPDGDVTGPGASTLNALAVFDDVTGKLLRNTAITVLGTGLNFGAAVIEPIQVTGTAILKSDNDSAFLGTPGPAGGGEFGVAIGSGASETFFMGERNVAVGVTALGAVGGEELTAVGHAAVGADTPILGTFVGKSAGISCSATDCVGLGIETLANTSGARNIAIGNMALTDQTTGVSNVAIGHNAADNLTGYASSVMIGHGITCPVTGTNIVAVGAQGNCALTSVLIGANASCETFSVAIGQGASCPMERSLAIGSGATSLAANTGVIDANPGNPQSLFVPNLTSPAASTTVEYNVGTGQIGPMVSSKRYKEDWQDLDFPSEVIDALQAMTFRFKKNGREDFGLLAEDVAEVPVIGQFLTVYDAEGRPSSIRYHMLYIVLLLELKRLRNRVAALEQAHMIEVM